MRVAIAAENNNGINSLVRGHFGDAPFFVLADVIGDQVSQVEVVQNPYHHNHQPGQVPQFLQQQGANVVLAGGMGHRAITFFDGFGIQVATGATGTAAQALNAFLSGELRGAAPCAHDDHHHHDHHHADHACEDHNHQH